jgi:hypothetical protein
MGEELERLRAVPIPAECIDARRERPDGVCEPDRAWSWFTGMACMDATAPVPLRLAPHIVSDT